MTMTRAERQREKYWAIKNGTWEELKAQRAAERAANSACDSGHEYVEGSFIWKTRPDGSRWRRCTECHNAQQRKDYAERMKDPVQVVLHQIKNHNNRAKRMGDDSRLTLEDVVWMWETYGEVCLACGSSDQLQIDHVVPVSKGGLNRRDNIQPLCKPHNNRKYNKLIDYRPVLAHT